MDDDTYNYSVHDSWGQAKPTKNYLAGPILYMSCLDTYIYIYTHIDDIFGFVPKNGMPQ